MEDSDLKTVKLKSADGQAIVAEVIKRAKDDPKFKDELLKGDVKAILQTVGQELGFDLRLHKETIVTVLEESKHQAYLVLPFDGILADKAEVSKQLPG